ncbi:MAG: MBL fold metallo-hydrolase [Bacteroidetes bacterium 4572_77]|nr:MAG: MBL fold metallo-hydrolase [Bacteroidetes bacterium 4572_77]
MVIDVPLESTNTILDYLEKNELVLKKIILTHGHYDHIAEAGLLSQKTKAIILMHENDADYLSDVDKHQRIFSMVGEAFYANFLPQQADLLLQHGDIINFGTQELKVLHTPGHTQGGICIVHEDSKSVFVGDTLFAGSIGRTDLPGGDLKQLISSIKENLLVLENDFLVLTGHGDKTTIGNEKIINGYLAT